MSDQPLSDPIQQEIAEEFGYFSDWSDRYQYLIDLGRKLPAFPEAWKIEANRLHGCQSMVWVVAEAYAQRLTFQSISDSAIVSGLVALTLRVYSGRSAAEIVATAPEFIERIGLGKHLSATRANGLGALIAKIKNTAAQA